jgi:hypothetical protein
VPGFDFVITPYFSLFPDFTTVTVSLIITAPALRTSMVILTASGRARRSGMI